MEEMALEEPSRPEKRKRVVLTLGQKIDICERLDRGERRDVLMKEFNVGSSTLYDIRAQKEQLLKFFSNSDTLTFIDHRRTLHKPKLEQLDNLLYQWYQSKQSEGVNIPGPLLIAKAKEFHQQLGLARTCSFSNGWLSRFKVRHGIKKLESSVTPSDKIIIQEHTDFIKNLVADHDMAEKYCEQFSCLITDHNLTSEQIFNADFTTLQWKYLPVSVFPKQTEHFTALLCANAAGTCKTKLLIVGANKNPPSFKGIVHLPVIYKVGDVGEIILHWFHHLFVPAVKQHFRNIGKSEDSDALLLLPSNPAFPAEKELTSGNIFTSFLPTNVTALIQPMAQGITHTLKCCYRRDLLRRFINLTTAGDFLRKYNLKDAVYNLACVWNSLKNETIKSCWKKLLNTSENLTEDEDDPVSQLRDVIKYAPTSSSVHKIQEMELEEWMEVDKEVNFEQKTNKCEVNFSADEVDVSWSCAASSIETFIKFAEKQTCYSAEEILQLHTIYSDFLLRRQTTNKQSEIKSLLQKVADSCNNVVQKEIGGIPFAASSQIINPGDHINNVSYQYQL